MGTVQPWPEQGERLAERDITLLELLDRALDKGVILWGDITISVANVDLVYVGLKVLVSSVETVEKMRKASAAQYALGGTLKG